MIGGLLSFSIAPLYIQFLGLERMGLLAVGQAFASYLLIARGGINVSTMILVAHAHGRGDWNEVAKVNRHGFALAAAAAGIASIAATLFVLAISNSRVARWFGLMNDEAVPLMAVIGAQVVVGLLAGNFYNLLTGLQRSHQAVVIQGAAQIVGSIAGAASAVLYGKAYAVVLSQTIVVAVAGVVAVVYSVHRYPAAYAKGPYERAAFVAHLRTGAKTFGVQVGSGISASAPVLMISQAAGAAAVPTFTLPLQILNLVNNLALSFARQMQPAFGEAWSKGERSWVRQTVVSLMEWIIFLLMVASAGFMAVGAPLVQAWVKLDISLLMILSVTVISASQTLTAWWRSLLVGINHHRVAAATELANALLTLLLCWVVCQRQIDAVFVGVLLAGLVSSYRVLPREIRHYLDARSLFPRPGRLLQMVFVSLCVYGSAAAVMTFGAATTRYLAFAQVGMAVVAGVAAFVLAASALRLVDLSELLKRLRRR